MAPMISYRPIRRLFTSSTIFLANQHIIAQARFNRASLPSSLEGWFVGNLSLVVSELQREKESRLGTSQQSRRPTRRQYKHASSPSRLIPVANVKTPVIGCRIAVHLPREVGARQGGFTGEVLTGRSQEKEGKGGAEVLVAERNKVALVLLQLLRDDHNSQDPPKQAQDQARDHDSRGRDSQDPFNRAQDPRSPPHIVTSTEAPVKISSVNYLTFRQDNRAIRTIRKDVCVCCAVVQASAPPGIVRSVKPCCHGKEDERCNMCNQVGEEKCITSSSRQSTDKLQLPTLSPVLSQAPVKHPSKQPGSHLHLTPAKILRLPATFTLPRHHRGPKQAATDVIIPQRRNRQSQHDGVPKSDEPGLCWRCKSKGCSKCIEIGNQTLQDITHRVDAIATDPVKLSTEGNLAIFNEARQLFDELHKSATLLQEISERIKKQEEFAKRDRARIQAEKNQDNAEMSALQRDEQRVAKANEYIRKMTALAGAPASHDNASEQGPIGLRGIKKVTLAKQRTFPERHRKIKSQYWKHLGRIRMSNGLGRDPAKGKQDRMRVLKSQRKQATAIEALLRSMAYKIESNKNNKVDPRAPFSRKYDLLTTAKNQAGSSQAVGGAWIEQTVHFKLGVSSVVSQLLYTPAKPNHNIFHFSQTHFVSRKRAALLIFAMSSDSIALDPDQPRFTVRVSEAGYILL
ncbi:uncharacterized protein B0J16DRAFT_315393 [Fusarium flagelliforme]|uniref:uncharacterized protein n=1 Tax=Fusarium flagelliforme TaxID=2675880 RepID=UPI001E8D666B|nr:uncharacterized protein B0J16DRAFT_315393 [Fusarium flagelliforme]KAH7199118.1 hypothetical protein B0J16DRAFT_315393 [Fusarium flagelliforme]